MKRICFLVAFLLMLGAVAGCGNEGSPASGSLEYVTVATKSSTSGVGFANISGASSSGYTMNQLSYTLTGHAYQGGTATKIQPYGIDFKTISYSYSPVNTSSCNTPSFNPAFALLQSRHTLLSGDGSTVDIENIPIFDSTDLVQIYNNAPTGTRSCQYDITFTFNGTESGTGVAVSVPVTTSTLVKIKK